MTHPLPVSYISKFILGLRVVRTEQLMSVLSCFPKHSFFSFFLIINIAFIAQVISCHQG